MGDEINADFRYSERGTRITHRRNELIRGGRRRCSPSAAASRRSIRRALDDTGTTPAPATRTSTSTSSRRWPVRSSTSTTTRRSRSGRRSSGCSTACRPEPIHLPVQPGKWKVLFQEVGGALAGPAAPRRRRPHRGGILDVMAKIDAITRDALERAEAFVITLGIIEIVGRHGHRPARVVVEGAATCPRSPSASQFHLTTYQENSRTSAGCARRSPTASRASRSSFGVAGRRC